MNTDLNSPYAFSLVKGISNHLSCLHLNIITFYYIACLDKLQVRADSAEQHKLISDCLSDNSLTEVKICHFPMIGTEISGQLMYGISFSLLVNSLLLE